VGVGGVRVGAALGARGGERACDGRGAALGARGGERACDGRGAALGARGGERACDDGGRRRARDTRGAPAPAPPPPPPPPPRPPQHGHRARCGRHHVRRDRAAQGDVEGGAAGAVDKDDRVGGALGRGVDDRVARGDVCHSRHNQRHARGVGQGPEARLQASRRAFKRRGDARVVLARPPRRHFRRAGREREVAAGAVVQGRRARHDVQGVEFFVLGRRAAPLPPTPQQRVQRPRRGADRGVIHFVHGEEDAGRPCQRGRGGRVQDDDRHVGRQRGARRHGRPQPGRQRPGAPPGRDDEDGRAEDGGGARQGVAQGFAASPWRRQHDIHAVRHARRRARGRRARGDGGAGGGGRGERRG